VSVKESTSAYRCRYHQPLDEAVVTLDCEELPFNCSGWMEQMRKDMIDFSSIWLTKHYPELIFTFTPRSAGGRPIGFDILERGYSGGWMGARWR